jgi:hypothetical protein
MMMRVSPLSRAADVFHSIIIIIIIVVDRQTGQ